MGALTGWKHCPRCASPLSGNDASRKCPNCGSAYYAHSNPAVSALVIDDGRVLLARRAFEPDAGMWDTPGGFLDEGEGPLDALRRELREETGLEVEPDSYVGSFVDTYGVGPDAVSVLNLAFEAHVVSGDIAPADDVSELRWFAPDELPPEDEYAFRWLAPFMRDWSASRLAGRG